MRILIDALPVANRSGTGYYVQKLVGAFGRMETPHEFIALVPPLDYGSLDHPDWPGGGHVQLVRVAPRAPWRQVVWRQWRLPRLARRYGIDLIHYPAFIGAVRCSTPSVLTVPDVVWREYRETIPPRKLGYYDRFIPDSMQVARRIIAISQTTADAIGDHFPSFRAKTRVVHLGVDRRLFHPMPQDARLETIRARYRLPARYVLALGTLEPRKNLGRLVAAFERVAQDDADLHLVLAGKPGYQAERLEELARSSAAAGRIVLPGHINQHDLPAVYGLASVFAFPSLGEGFGLPILEAMACHVPVLTGNRSAMKEVAGDAAELVDPESVDAIAAGLRRLLTDAERRRALATRGGRRAAHFSWERTAASTVAVYEDALS